MLKRVITKGQDLMKWVIFSVSSETLVNESVFFFCLFSCDCLAVQAFIYNQKFQKINILHIEII